MSNTNNAGATTKKNYVLFVHAKCKGSQEAISMLNGSGLHSSIEVQNVAQIPATMLPQYVTGVPTVVDLRAREVHRGTACVQFLEKKIKEDIPAYGGGMASGYGSFENGGACPAGGGGFSSIDVSEQLSGPSFEEDHSSMDVTKYQQMRNQMLAKSK